MKKEKRLPPTISVLMAVYNGELWLKESIRSVLKQTFSNFEFIIINDGSEDSSVEIIESFIKKDTRILLFNKSNTGLADSLNYGMMQAKGKWVARIDADDICESNRLQEQLDFVKLNKDYVLVGSGLNIIDEKGKNPKLTSIQQSTMT